MASNAWQLVDEAVSSGSLAAAEKKDKETTNPLLGQRDYIRDQMQEIERAKTELKRTCDDQDLLNELAKAERQLNVLHTRSNEMEFAIAERKRRLADLKEVAHSLEHPQEVSNRDESAICQQVTDFRDRASHHEKEIAELEKTLMAWPKRSRQRRRRWRTSEIVFCLCS